ncbi:MAG: DnaD domain protein [SAR202 cluster bacterium]|nr:hypothetical protein [Chloroflexota bacterium]MQG51397.1 DnaD domain protein [SAR202 cluster bacterium]|tara:strand:- start:3784 stop:4518 length:735 start_codon:yes stop_codon:yes gene_type:complete
MKTDNGFKFNNRNYIPIPIELTSSLLKDIDSYEEFKCTLRVFSLIFSLRPKRLWISFEELIADPVLLESIHPSNSQNKTEIIIKSIYAAKKRKTIIIREKVKDQIQNSIILINDKISNELLKRKDIGNLDNGLDLEQTDFQSSQKPQSNIYGLYEDNIGQMTPLLAEELKLAEKKYPNSWIQEAITEAVKNNIRNWKYISSILNRWQIEGRTNGESTRYSKKSERESQLRRAQKFRDEFINKKS